MAFFLFASLCFGLLSGANGVIDWVAIGAAVSSAVMTGTTMLHSSLSSVEYNVAIEVVVENWSKYPLTLPESIVNGGVMKYPPVTVKGGQRENFIAHKTGNTATGTYGTASWLIQNSGDRRAVVMWSVPYSQDFHSNWLGVGLTTPGTPKHKDWFDQMYYRSSGNGLKFVRAEYYRGTQTISVKDDKFEITGTMGTTHKTKAHIIFRPLNEADVADSLKDIVKMHSKKSLTMLDMRNEWPVNSDSTRNTVPSSDDERKRLGLLGMLHNLAEQDVQNDMILQEDEQAQRKLTELQWRDSIDGKREGDISNADEKEDEQEEEEERDDGYNGEDVLDRRYPIQTLLDLLKLRSDP